LGSLNISTPIIASDVLLNKVANGYEERRANTSTKEELGTITHKIAIFFSSMLLGRE
jgi:hypothetical protein